MNIKKYNVIFCFVLTFACVDIYANMPNNPEKNAGGGTRIITTTKALSSSQNSASTNVRNKLASSINGIGGENPVETVSKSQIALGEVSDDTKVVVRLYSPGATFEDGSTVKTFTAKDFDSSGTCKYQINKTLQKSGAMHSILIYQNNAVVRNILNWQ